MIKAYIDAAVAGKVNRTGDQMEGDLGFDAAAKAVLDYEPMDLEDGTNKQYVDGRADEKVSKSGDSMTGLLSSNSNIRLTGHNGAVQFQVRANSGTQHSGTSGLDNRGLMMGDWQGAGVFHLRYDDPQKTTQCHTYNGTNVKFKAVEGGMFYF